MQLPFRFFTEGIFSALVLLLSSFIAYFIPQSSFYIFYGLVIIFAVLSYKNLTLGALLIFAELSLGGHGYMIRLPFVYGYISLRHIWFFVFLIIFALKHRGALYILWQRRTITLDLIIGTLFVTLYGAVLGILRGNGLKDVFFDANAFIFLLMFFPIVYIAVRDSTFLQRITYFLLGSLTVLSFMTLLTFFIFSNAISIAPAWYMWVRDVRIGEITDIGGLYRVFFQSHIFLLIAVIVFGILSFIKQFPLNFYSHKTVFFIFPIIFIGSLIVSMSRSFALGITAGIATVFGVALFLGKITLKDFPKLVIKWLFIFLCALLLVGLLSGSFFDVTHFKERLQIAGDPAVDSRWALIKPVMEEIKNNPVFGEGFGTSVSFKTSDPRIIETTEGTGEYQTYSFEWGFFDLWLKTGFFGLIVWLVLLFSIIRSAFDLLRRGESVAEALSAVGIVVTVAVVHFFTPYLNHPLGIMIVILMTIAVEKKYELA